jgi:soluble lytic murein transglycosylase-like protein
MRSCILFFCCPALKRILKLTLLLAVFFLITQLGKNTINAVTFPPTILPQTTVNKQVNNINPVYNQMISEAGERHGVDPELIRLVIDQESGFKASARSPKNARGLMQLIPETAQRFGIKNPWDPRQNIEGGTRYLKWLLERFDGDVKLALAGYNAGENAVKRFGNKIPPYKETREYVKKITAAYGKTYHEL